MSITIADLRLTPSYTERTIACPASAYRYAEMRKDKIERPVLQAAGQHGINFHAILEQVLLDWKAGKEMHKAFLKGLERMQQEKFVRSHMESLADVCLYLFEEFSNFGIIKNQKIIAKHRARLYIEHTYVYNIQGIKGRGRSDLELDIRGLTNNSFSWVVYDFKTGRYVSAVKNMQLMMRTHILQKDEGLEQVLGVILNCHFQDSMVSAWQYGKEDIEDDFVMPLLQAVAKLKEMLAKKNDKGVTGDHCRYCPALFYCKELQDLLGLFIDFAIQYNEGGEKVIRKIKDSDLPRLLDSMGVVTHFVNACKEEAISRLEKGKAVKGWGLVQTQGHRKYIDPEDVVKAFHKTIGEKLFEKSLRSPAQLARLVGASNLDPYLERSTFYKLERSEAIATTKANQLFSKKEGK